jgi:hypothetical protein
MRMGCHIQEHSCVKAIHITGRSFFIFYPYQLIYCQHFSNSYYEVEAGRYSVAKYKGSEAVYVSNVNIIGSDWSAGMNKVTITFRIPVMTILKCYPWKCFFI